MGKGMNKKQVRLEKVSESLLALAPHIVNKGCAFFLAGEPKLPKKLKKL